MPALRIRFAAAAFLLSAVLVSPVTAQPKPVERKPLQAGKPEAPAVKPQAKLPGFGDWVTSVAFSPDGSRLAVGAYDEVVVFDVAEREKIDTLKTRAGYAKSLAFSPDGKSLLVGAYQTLQIWDTADWSRAGKLAGHRGYVTGIAFDADGSRFATSSDDGTVRVWNAADASELLVLDALEFLAQDVAFSPDGKLLATAGGDPDRVTKPGPVKLWNAESGEPVRELVPHEKACNAVAFSPDGTFLASCSEDEKVNVYDVASGKALGYFAGHGRPTNDAIFSPDGSLVISASGGRAKGNNDVRIWTRTEGEEKAVLAGHGGPINDVALSPDGKTLASGSNDETVLLWDVAAVLGTGAQAAAAAEGEAGKELKAGIIGLDTSHVIAFTKLLNAEDKAEDLAGVRVVAAYPQGSADIESSASRIPGYTKQMQEMGIEIVDSIPALLEKVDVVLLETNDGRLHLEQIVPVLKSGKRVFVDKPFSASLVDAVAIFDAAEKYDVPIFTSSSLRFSSSPQELRSGESEIGKVLGCNTYSPASLEKTHPDMFWYGIHGIELLYAIMGPGCEEVVRTHAEGQDVVTGQWNDGRIGTFRGIRNGAKGYGGTAFGEKGIQAIGKYEGYRPLVVEIVKFLKGGETPIEPAESIELHAFMVAADESKRRGGEPVKIDELLDEAREAARGRLAEVEKQVAAE